MPKNTNMVKWPGGKGSWGIWDNMNRQILYRACHVMKTCGWGAEIAGITRWCKAGEAE